MVAQKPVFSEKTGFSDKLLAACRSGILESRLQLVLTGNRRLFTG